MSRAAGTVVIDPGDPEPAPFPLDDLTDVNAPTARAGNVVIGTVAPRDVGSRGSAATRHRRTPAGRSAASTSTCSPTSRSRRNFGSSPSDAGLVLKFDGDVWRRRPTCSGEQGPMRETEPHVRCRPTPYAIVAGGVVELEFNEDGFLEDAPTASQLVTRYGGLEVKRISRPNASAVCCCCSFRGYNEARASFPRLERTPVRGQADRASRMPAWSARRSCGSTMTASWSSSAGPRDNDSDEFRELGHRRSRPRS